MIYRQSLLRQIISEVRLTLPVPIFPFLIGPPHYFHLILRLLFILLDIERPPIVVIVIDAAYFEIIVWNNGHFFFPEGRPAQRRATFKFGPIGKQPGLSQKPLFSGILLIFDLKLLVASERLNIFLIVSTFNGDVQLDPGLIFVKHIIDNFLHILHGKLHLFI